MLHILQVHYQAKYTKETNGDVFWNSKPLKTQTRNEVWNALKVKLTKGKFKVYLENSKE